MKSSKNPYVECEKCITLEDCSNPDVAQDGFGTPLPPELCLRAIDVMKATLKKRKLKNSKYDI